MNPYNHKKIEEKWRKKWREDNLYKTPDSAKGKENFYTLVEFPYPSGNLHIGHWYAFSVPDIYTRFKRMRGFNVLYPIGFDSFGLPAENAAIKRGLDPRKWTYGNIDHMKEQLESMGASFDWSREVRSSDSEYYRWTQWIFTKMFEKGLAYKAETNVNFCPSCKTVLANEQVVNGLCERCDSEVEIKRQKQWMLKITDYAERLLNDLDSPADGLDWPEEIKQSQRNWIGKSEGALIKFEIPACAEASAGRRNPKSETNSKSQIQNLKQEVEVFTTRPDTLLGATYLVLAPEHSWLEQEIRNPKSEIRNKSEVQKYINQAKKKSELERQTGEKEKTGVELKGVKAINPANGEEIPVWIADYVLEGYGTGAIMAVPAHDERDFQFAKKFNLPIRQVIRSVMVDERNPPKEGFKNSPRKGIIAIVKNPTGNKVLTLKWKHQDWQTFVIGGVEEGEDIVEAAKREIREETGYIDLVFEGQVGQEVRALFHAPHKNVNREAFTNILLFKLNSEEKEEVSEDEMEKHTPEWSDWNVVPNLSHAERFLIEEWLKTGNYTYTGEGEIVNSGQFNGLKNTEAKEKITKFVGGEKKTTYKLRDWSVGRQRYWGTPIPIVYDPEGKPHPVPEKHLPWTLPDDVDFKPTGEPPLAKSKELLKRTEEIFGDGWRPEVETLDTFIDSSWYFLRYLDPKNEKQISSKEKQKNWMPVDLYFGGSEHTTLHLLYSRFFQKVLFDLGFATEEEPYRRRINRGLIMGPDGQKMSKSRGNVIDPDEMVERVGSDAVKMYLAFIGPYAETGSYPWDMGGISGVRKFLEKVFTLGINLSEEGNEEIEKELHRTIKKCSEDIEQFKFNTAISSMMTFLNKVNEKGGKISKHQYKTLLRLLAPFAPFLTEELWQENGEKDSIHSQDWPDYDKQMVEKEEFQIAVQVNGKVRDFLQVPKDTAESEIQEKALSMEKVKKWIGDGKVKKVIHIKNRLINIVV